MTVSARVLPRIFAAIVCSALFLVARPVGASPGARERLASKFAFTDLGWPEPTAPAGAVRRVNPSLKGIDGWVSSVGAAVSLGDIDGDGLANDACAVDPRTDTVTVSVVPGTTNRYPAFELRPDGLRYDNTMAPMGCVLGDLNEDGLTDVLVYYWGRSPILFFRTPGTDLNARAFRSEELDPEVPRWYTNAALFADLDGDGHLDIVVANYFADGARILDPHSDTADHMQASMSAAFNGGGKYFFRAERTASGVAFEPVDTGLSYDELHGWTLALGARDLDGDLLPELYLANDFGPDRLLANRSTPGHLRFTSVVGQRHFTTPKSSVLGEDSFKGMGVDFGDLNGDGTTDIFVSNITDSYALLERNFAFLGTGDPSAIRRGLASFDDHSESLGLVRSGWAWDVKLADFNNDGTDEVVQATGFLKGQTNRWPELQELAMANDALLSDPNWWPHFGPGDDLSGSGGIRFYARDGGRFVEISSEVGLSRQTVSRGIAVADVFGNGDLDFAVANQWDDFSFYRNDCPSCGNSLELRLRRSTQPGGEAKVADDGMAIGATTGAASATVAVVLPDGRRLTDAVDGGNGHSGRRSDELHFGLGDVSAAVRVEVAWRDIAGTVQRTVLPLGPGRHTIVIGGT